MPDGTRQPRTVYGATLALALREAEGIEDRAWRRAGKVHPRNKAKLA
jgi:hypothetical protein